jgi:Domain of unknown function (DUF4153)
MNERTKKGLDCLEAALVLGLLADLLLRATPWGINVLLWAGALAAALVALRARWRSSSSGNTFLKDEGRWLVPSAFFFAAAFAWRDSMTLKSLDFLALLLTLALLAWQAEAKRMRLAGFFDYVLGVGFAGLNALFAFFPLVLVDVRWKEIPRAGWSRHLFAVARGLIIAAPLLLVFGLLFMAADAVFEGLVNNTLNINASSLFTHTFMVVFFTWIVGGYLRGAIMGEEKWLVADQMPVSPLNVGLDAQAGSAATGGVNDGAASQASPGVAAAAPARLRMGIVEIGVVLGLLNLLFLSFVVVQVRYFFGGAALVQTSTGLTYAEYARRGFFELVTVAALVLPLLLAAHWLLRKDNPAHERIFRALAGFKIALLFVIMASAVGRMRLYQSEYGLTELRVYTTAFMGWLALVFVWFVLTVLRGERERFMYGALVTALLVTGALHVINPDALIVRTNIAQVRDGRRFDSVYVSMLSADAVPALVEALPAMNHYDQCLVTTGLLRRYDELGRQDWRSWNRSRALALKVIEERASDMRAVACPQLYPSPFDQSSAGRGLDIDD